MVTAVDNAWCEKANILSQECVAQAKKKTLLDFLMLGNVPDAALTGLGD
jgi:hypothetical protein